MSHCQSCGLASQSPGLLSDHEVASAGVSAVIVAGIKGLCRLNGKYLTLEDRGEDPDVPDLHGIDGQGLRGGHGEIRMQGRGDPRENRMPPVPWRRRFPYPPTAGRRVGTVREGNRYWRRRRPPAPNGIRLDLESFTLATF